MRDRCRRGLLHDLTVGHSDSDEVGLVDVDTIALGEEGIEALNEVGVTMEELRDACDDAWGINATAQPIISI